MGLFRLNAGSWIAGTVLVCASISSALGQGSTPPETVRAVLIYEQRHDNARDSILNKRNLDTYRKWMTASLYQLFLTELAREEQEARIHTDEKPYLGDGMQFSPVKEYCKENGRVYKQQFSLSKGTASRGSAIVPASFFYNKACGGREPTVVRFTLVRRPSGWLIDDIDYGPNGSLRRVLGRVGH